MKLAPFYNSVPIQLRRWVHRGTAVIYLISNYLCLNFFLLTLRERDERYLRLHHFDCCTRSIGIGGLFGEHSCLNCSAVGDDLYHTFMQWIQMNGTKRTVDRIEGKLYNTQYAQKQKKSLKSEQYV